MERKTDFVNFIQTELKKKVKYNKTTLEKIAANYGIVDANNVKEYKDYKGKLVSFTTHEGSVRKGILMPENWTPKDVSKGENSVSVPIKFIADIILKMQSDSNFTTSIGLRIYKTYRDNYKLYIPHSRQKFGHVFLDADILKIVDDNNFNKISDNMVATISMDKMPQLIQLLQDKFNASVDVHENLLNTTLQEVDEHVDDVVLKLNHKTKKQLPEDTDNFEMEALALELELELLNF